MKRLRRKEDFFVGQVVYIQETTYRRKESRSLKEKKVAKIGSKMES